ncbi:MAG TPA: VOC family protein [Thermoanaerobaculia bacterium]|nr:VOC family protein [Thermoanaerobaculia bacterium]
MAPTIVPRIFLSDAKGLVAFIKKVFGATGDYQSDRPTWLTIDSAIMVSDVAFRKPMAAFLYVYVDDAEATYRVAMQACARSLEEPLDTPYGDRRCMIEDRWGNTWQIATRH